MKIRRGCSLAAVLALAAVGLSAGTASGAGVQRVPFHGSFSGTATFTSPTTVAFSGEGVASHLGRGTNAGMAVITGPDSTIPGGLDDTNTETFTAANGDTITLTSRDVAVPVAPGVTHGTGSWQVTAGTGRFRDASGEGTLDGYADFNRGTFTFHLNGSVSTPGAGTH